LKKYIVTLTAEERQDLSDLIAAGKAAAQKLAHARILLKADAADGGPAWPDGRIAEALETSLSTVERVRKRYVAEGLQAALQHRPPRATKPRKLDGHAEAHLIALSRSAPPQGRDRWTMQLLADKLEIHPTPTHGSWLNMAEVELAVLAKQCLDRRIPDLEQLASEVASWETDRNRTASTIDWRFTTADARIRLKRLYPTP
jgi:hypothetical protein